MFQLFMTALALFFGCLVFTAVTTPAVMRLAHKVGAVDRGGYRKVFRGDIPLLGGLGIAIPFILLSLGAGIAGFFIVANWQWLWINHRDWFSPLFSIAGYRHELITLAVGGIGIVALGLLDDTRDLRARWKLMGQVAVAAFVCLSGHVLSTVAIPFVGAVELGWVAGSLLTMLWVVGLINAFNLIDGIDGLASGIALVGAVALVALSVLEENALVMLACAALAGSVLAFLLYNFPPAKMFLGDTGSMFLGYVLAMMSLIGTQKSEAAVIVLAPMLALSLPIFETFVSMLRRYLHGVPIFAGDNRHTHHRLLRKGYSQPQVVLTLCGTGLLLSAAAILSAIIPENSTWAWCPYALYIGTLVNIAWLAGYLRPTNVWAVLERRQRNKMYQAFGRYARLRLNNGLYSSATAPLLELCRHELGIRNVQIQIRDGLRLAASPENIEIMEDDACREELLVKSSDAQDILIFYQFEDTPDANRRHDVSFCLAGIFDGLPVMQRNVPKRTAAAAQDEGHQAKVVSFKSRFKRGGRA